MVLRFKGIDLFFSIVRGWARALKAPGVVARPESTGPNRSPELLTSKADEPAEIERSRSRVQRSPAALVRTEAAALEALATRLEGPMAEPFARAVELILGCGQGNGRVVVTGMGKSGIIAQKIAATLSSTGSPALFLHPAEAVHGDLGVLMPGDVVIALSGSGETEEILRLLATLKRKGDALVSFCCNLNSTLALASDVALDCGVEREACGLNLAPTASTTAMLALGRRAGNCSEFAQGISR